MEYLDRAFYTNFEPKSKKCLLFSKVLDAKFVPLMPFVAKFGETEIVDGLPVLGSWLEPKILAIIYSKFLIIKFFQRHLLLQPTIRVVFNAEHAAIISSQSTFVDNGLSVISSIDNRVGNNSHGMIPILKEKKDIL